MSSFKFNLKIRVLLSVFIGVILLVSVFGGGLHGIYASTQDISEIEEYGFTSTTVFTQETVQNHVQTLAFSEEYTYSYDSQISLSQQGVTGTTESVYVSNESNQAYGEYTTRDQSASTQKQVLETESELEVIQNGETMFYDKTEDSSGYEDHTILENQLLQQNHIIEVFASVEWAVIDQNEDYVEYTVSNVPSSAVDEISRIENTGGEIRVDKDTGVIRQMNLYVSGSSAEYAGEQASVIYSAEFPKDVEQPDISTETESEIEEE